MKHDPLHVLLLRGATKGYFRHGYGCRSARKIVCPRCQIEELDATRELEKPIPCDCGGKEWAEQVRGLVPALMSKAHAKAILKEIDARAKRRRKRCPVSNKSVR